MKRAIATAVKFQVNENVDKPMLSIVYITKASRCSVWNMEWSQTIDPEPSIAVMWMASADTSTLPQSCGMSRLYSIYPSLTVSDP